MDKKRLITFALLLVSPFLSFIFSFLTAIPAAILFMILNPNYCEGGSSMSCGLGATLSSLYLVFLANILLMFFLATSVYLITNKERSSKEKIITLSVLFLYYLGYSYYVINGLVGSKIPSPF